MRAIVATLLRRGRPTPVHVRLKARFDSGALAREVRRAGGRPPARPAY